MFLPVTLTMDECFKSDRPLTFGYLLELSASTALGRQTEEPVQVFNVSPGGQDPREQGVQETPETEWLPDDGVYDVSDV